MGSILRKDYFGNWVLIAKDRAFRPQQFAKPKKKTGIDPFAPGKEKMTPPETGRIEKAGKWVFRSFPNKYSFAPEGEAHEVIVEARERGRRLSDFTPNQIFDLFRFYQHTFKRLSSQGYAYLFKNEGSAAGASIPHSHSQIVTLPEKPQIVLQEENCLDFRKILKKEYEYVISDDELSFSYCPHASKFALESWIVCKRKGSTLGNLTVEELSGVSKKLLQIMKKLDKKAGEPDFNILHHNSPNYHIHIIPRVATMAGLEIGMHSYVNIVPPKEALRFYKK